MGAHHAQQTSSSPHTTAVRAAVTAAAAVALTGTGAGVALADTVSDTSTDTTSDATTCSPSDAGSLAGLDLAGLTGLGGTSDDADRACDGPSWTGDDVFGPSSDRYDATADRRDDSRASTRSDRQVRPASSTGETQERRQGPQSRAQDTGSSADAARSNPVDTPPPPGQTRIIKLPGATQR